MQLELGSYGSSFEKDVKRILAREAGGQAIVLVLVTTKELETMGAKLVIIDRVADSFNSYVADEVTPMETQEL